MGVSAYNLAKASDAVSQGKGYDVNQSRNLPFLGKVKPLGGIVAKETATELAKATTRKIKGQETTIDQQKKINEAAKAQKEYGFKGVKESIGTGLEVGSYLPIGLGTKGATIAAKGAYKALPLSKQIVKGAKIMGAESAIGGGLYSTGKAQQENKGFVDTLKEGAIGSLSGLAGGAVLGAVAPIIGKGIRTTARMYNPVIKAEDAVDQANKLFQRSTSTGATAPKIKFSRKTKEDLWSILRKEQITVGTIEGEKGAIIIDGRPAVKLAETRIGKLDEVVRTRLRANNTKQFSINQCFNASMKMSKKFC